MKFSVIGCGLTAVVLSLGILVCTIPEDAGSIIDPGNPLQPGSPAPVREKPTLIASADSAYVRVGDTLAIRVRVFRDSTVTDSSRGLAGARIGVTGSAGWISRDTLISDVNGRATLLFTDSVFREAVQIHFSCNGASMSVRFMVTNTPVRVQKLIEAMPDKPVVKADGRDFTLINVRVMNRDHNPLAGEAVQFVTTAGMITGLTPPASRAPGQSLTDENGIATARLLSTNVNDTAFVTVFLASNRSLSDETQVAFQGVTISIKTDSSNLRTGARTMVTAQVLNASNVPVSRARIYFSLANQNSNLELDPSLRDTITGFDGMARVFIVGRNTGTDTVIVSAAGATAKISINVSNLSLRTTVYPATLQASKDTATLEVIFTRSDASPLAVRPITVIKRYPGRNGVENADTLRGTTDSAGVCRFKIPALAYDGLIRLETAAINSSTEIATSINTIECVTTRVMTMNAFPAAIMADGSDRAAITVQIRNENNNPIVGDEVSFVSSAGTIPATAITDSSGKATVFLLSERRNAVAAVVATLVKDRTRRDSIQVEFSGVTLDLSANPRSISTYGTDSSMLRVVVLDATKKPIAGERVFFSHRKDTSYITDARGVAQSAIRGKGSPATRDTIIARAAGASDTVVLKYSNNRILIQDTLPRPHIANGRDSTRISVLYQKENGEPIEGVDLKIAVTMGSIRIAADAQRGTPADTVFFGVRKTGSDGRTSFHIKNPEFPDSATVHIIASDQTETEASRKFFFAADRISRITLEGTPAVIGLAPARATIIATAYDARGNRVSNALIAFNMLGGPGGGTRLEPGSRVTGPDGTARIELVAGIVPSTFEAVRIVAGDSSQIKSDTLRFTIAGPPASITVRTNVLKAINPNDGTFRLPTAALVSDINGNPVADGTPVTFSLKVSGFVTYPLRPSCGTYWFENRWYCSCDIVQDTAILPFEDFNDNYRLDPGEDRNGDGVASRGEDFNGDGIYCPGPAFIDINRNGKRDFDWTTPVEARGWSGCEDSWADMWANSLWDPIEPLDDTLYLRVYRAMRASRAFERLLLGRSIWAAPNVMMPFRGSNSSDSAQHEALIAASDAAQKAILDSMDAVYRSGSCYDPVHGYDYNVNQNGYPDPSTSVNIVRTVQTINGKAVNEIQYGQSDARVIEVMIWAESQGVRTRAPEQLVLPLVVD